MKFRFGSYLLDQDSHELLCDGAAVACEPQVFDLLSFLAENAGQLISHDNLIENVWQGRIVSDSAISARISAARAAIGDDGTQQKFIKTVPKRGFRFVAKVDSLSTNEVLITPEKFHENEKSAATSSRHRVIAVLPFENLSGDADQNYLSDGITEDLTTALSKNRWLTVIARNSAFAFRNTKESTNSVGQKLGASYLVTGSVRIAKQRVRITVQVVDVARETSIWSERFDRDMVDIFDLQDDITELVSSRIESELGLTEQRKAKKRSRKNLGAWELYQLGVAEFNKFTRRNNLKSQELLRQSLGLDPELASAYSKLAYSIVLSMVYFEESPENARMDEALELAKRAIELDDQDANSYFTIGRVFLARCEYQQAIDALEHAIELNPYLAVTYCGLGDSLAYEGRTDEAIEQFEIAIRLSPHDPFRWAFYSYGSLAQLFRGDYENAISWARKSVQIPNSHYWARANLISALGHSGNKEQAQSELNQLESIKPEFSLEFARERMFYIKRPDQIETYIEGLKKAGVT